MEYVLRQHDKYGNLQRYLILVAHFINRDTHKKIKENKAKQKIKKDCRIETLFDVQYNMNCLICRLQRGLE